MGLDDLLTAFPLPWSAYVRLLTVRDENAGEFYETEALRGGWSVHPFVSETYGDSNSASRAAVCGKWVIRAGLLGEFDDHNRDLRRAGVEGVATPTTVATWTLPLSSSNGISKSGNLFSVSIR